uniref:Ankyrin repeat domain-containing protein 43 n=1 Tax=Oncorhynchus mykiss TaxID=8022 RepID=C1BIC2_ONCMY|nr:Ankyrin repeat domain-containing protein 43 [Oncorhynchus mykiss]
MYNGTSIREPTDNSVTHFQPLQDGGALESGSEQTNNGQDSDVKQSGQANVLDRLSRAGVRAFPASVTTYASARRSRLQRQPVVCDTNNSSSERGSLTPAMRKIYLKDLFLNSSGGFASVRSSTGSGASSREIGEEVVEGWALCPMEHAWMLSVVDGNYETIVDFLSEDSSLLTRKDFVSGFTVLHWLAKSGQDETLIQLLRHAENEGIPVNVNLKGGGGLTPLHVAAMHSRYVVIKILVGAFGANIDAMDYNGRKAWQYLKGNAPEEMKELLGTWDDEHRSVGQQNTNNSATLVPKSELSDEERDDPVYFDRTRRNGSWRGSFKKLLAPFLSFVNKN